MKIILLRHAKVEYKNSPIYANQTGEWIEQYNRASIDTTTPQNLPNADIYITSEMKRSIDSLALLGKNPRLKNALFNEAMLPYLDKKLFKLPPTIWAVVFRIAWLFVYSKNAISFKDSKLEAKEGAKILADLAKDADVMLVGHGVKNRLIAKELQKIGFKETENRGSKNWGFIILET
jgi:broad specificity phosphatase PhoE